MKKHSLFLNLTKAYLKKARGGDKGDPMCLPFTKHKILYVPIPKAANTSIKHALCANLLSEDVSDTHNIHQDPRVPKVAFSEIQDSINADWFVFTVVRNPYDRSRSAYLDKVIKDKARIHGVRELGIEPDDSYLDLLQVIRLWPRRLLNNHFIPQTMLLKDAMALPNLRVYKYERLATAWEDIADEVEKRVGNGRPYLDVHNATSSSEAETSALERDFVRRIYRDDFRAFAYPEW